MQENEVGRLYMQESRNEAVCKEIETVHGECSARREGVRKKVDAKKAIEWVSRVDGANSVLKFEPHFGIKSAVNFVEDLLTNCRRS